MTRYMEASEYSWICKKRFSDMEGEAVLMAVQSVKISPVTFAI